MAKKKQKKIAYRSLKTGRFASKKQVSLEMEELGLTLIDYENTRKLVQKFGVGKEKNTNQAIKKSLSILDTEREYDEDYEKVIKFISETKNKKLKFFLNGKKTKKISIVNYISDYPLNFNGEFHFFYINVKVSSNSYNIDLDEELKNKFNKIVLENGNSGIEVEDRYGNRVFGS